MTSSDACISFKCFDLIRKMIEIGNPNAITDVGVAALCAKTAVVGAYLNLKINCQGLDDKHYANDILEKAENYVSDASIQESDILKIIKKRL